MMKIGFLAISALLFSTAAYSTPIKWTLENVLFENGNSLAGSFIYDADTDLFSSVNVSVIDSSGGQLFTYISPCASSNLYSLFATTQACTEPANGLNVLFIEPDDALTNDGGLLELDDDTSYGICANPNCTNVISTTYLDTGSIRGVPYITPPSAPTSVPTLNEWGLLLLASVMGALVFWRQRRTS